MNVQNLTLLQTNLNAYMTNNIASKNKIDNKSGETVSESSNIVEEASYKTSEKIADMTHNEFRRTADLKELTKEIKGDQTTKVLSKAISKLSLVMGGVAGATAVVNGAAGDSSGAAINAAISLSSLILSKVASMKEKSISKDQLAQVYHLRAKVEKSREFIEDKKNDPKFEDNKEAQKYFKKLTKLYDNLDKMADKMEQRQLQSTTLDKKSEYGLRVGNIKRDVERKMDEY